MVRNLMGTVLTAAFVSLSAQALAQTTPPPPLQTAYSPGEQRVMDDYQRLPKAQAFSDCDGYGEPTRMGDGMADYAFKFGIFVGSGDQRRDTPTLSRNGVPACHVALRRLEAFPNFALRRASLWRARAIHRLAAGEPDAAIADLDLAEEALRGTADPYHLRSLKLGMDLVRAYALHVKGDQTGAERLALQAVRLRPLSRTTGYAALIAAGDDISNEAFDATARSLAKVTPLALGFLYDETFERGRYAEVLELYSGLVPPEEHGAEPMQLRQRAMLEQKNRVSAEEYWARAAGQRAYALAALGRTQDAKTALAEAEARIAAAGAPPAPLPLQASVEQMTQFAAHEQGNADLKAKVPQVLADWRRLVDARILLNEGKLEAAAERFHAKGAPMMPTSATIEFLLAISKKAPEFKVDEQELRAGLRKARKAEAGKDLVALFETLPETETARRRPESSKGGDLTWLNGYSVKARPDGKPGMVVSLAGSNATAAMTQEAALLKAAELALADGKDSLLVLRDIDIQRTTINTYYSTPVSQTPNGFVSRIEVVFLNAGALPSEFAAQKWRLLDARQVQDTLQPFYRRQKATAAAGAK